MLNLQSTSSINCRGRLLTLDRVRIMGILNVTPDSFSDGGQFTEVEAALHQAEAMLDAGADILDIGGYSSRPHADHIDIEEEISRLEEIVGNIIMEFPEAIISIDTFRSKVASSMLDMGAHIINDIRAGRGMDNSQSDGEMFSLIAQYGNVPYIMMHMAGTPADMQQHPSYENVVDEVWDFFVERINRAKDAGIVDLIVDPGFGFGKTILHNYQLFEGLKELMKFQLPLLVGISRKSMMYKLFNTVPKDVGDLTGILHFKAMEMGARLFRVHDVKEAKRVGEFYHYLRDNGII
ncbi:MAG: dihydropteroate synthase [Bacteroidota bacterium]